MGLSIEVVQPNLYAAVVADEIVACAKDAISLRGSCSIALSGGTTPGAVYRALAHPDRSGEVEWSKVKFFLGDERYVSLTDQLSNYRMICETLIDPLKFPRENFFFIDYLANDRQKAVSEYEKTLKRELVSENGEYPIDVVLLGIGEDGHIASLFPGGQWLEDQSSLVVATTNPADSTPRVSLTPRMLLNSRKILFLVRGENKSKILKSVFEDKGDVADLPALMLKPILSRVTWFLDSAAAVSLPSQYR